MATSMWMTISVFVVVAMAATVVDSTPLQEQGLSRNDRDNPGCCRWDMYDCLYRQQNWRNSLNYCYNKGVRMCTSPRDVRCCNAFFHCLNQCPFGDHAICYSGCKDVPCWLR
nr:TPA_inf: conotoxin precursor Con-ikot-ikot [Conus ebraeus]